MFVAVVFAKRVSLAVAIHQNNQETKQHKQSCCWCYARSVSVLTMVKCFVSRHMPAKTVQPLHLYVLDAFVVNQLTMYGIQPSIYSYFILRSDAAE